MSSSFAKSVAVVYHCPMSDRYKSFVNDLTPEPDYDCSDLRASGYELRVECNKNNSDCIKFLDDRKKEGHAVKIVDLDTAKHGNDMVHIWVKEHSSFRKLE
jgi:hypothetical protein